MACAQDQTPSTGDFLRKFGFIGPGDDPVFGPILNSGAQSGAPVGSAPSRHAEVATAFRLLFETPRNVPEPRQLEIAKYFMNIKQTNEDKEPYNYEWAVRANPLVVGFFSMTNTLPSEGDQTSWCAAFVNFCLYAAGKPTTFSALSGSFRYYSTPTENPRPGDIVVFALHGEQGAKGFGHVGFFVSRNPDGSMITVLGGNQRGTTGSTGAVTTTTFHKESASLRLHSYRSVA
jgi:uncharacterized protein (TIGR02594 family)